MSRSKGSASGTATKRLLHELQSYATELPPCLSALGPTSDDSLLEWDAILKGPDGTPYEDATFPLHLTLPATYPLSPPILHFTTTTLPIHANIHPKTGALCLDLLTPAAWSPAYTLATTLEAVQRLLAEPNADSPLDVDVAVMMRNGDDVAVEGLVRWGVWKGRRDGERGGLEGGRGM